MSRLRCSLVFSITKGPLRCPQLHRVYARAYPASNESVSNILRRQKEHGTGTPSSVGPFPLGVQPLNLHNSREPPVEPWDKLTTGGKVLRTTARASNLTVILFGATLSVVLAYALATELFARNSPTVLYGEACDRIRDSPAVKAHLPGALSFHTTPPALVPTRHRNRHPQSHLAVDSNGVEHLLLHFWITSSHLTDARKPTQSWVQSLRDEWDVEWNWERVQEISAHFKDKARCTWESVKHTAAFVSGIPIQPPSSQAPPLDTTTRQHRVEEERLSESRGLTFLGLFRNLKLGGGMSKSNNASPSSTATQWDTAEVHVDLVKDVSGVFQYRYLLVDLPNSRVRRPTRLVIESGHNFSERDGIFMWQ